MGDFEMRRTLPLRVYYVASFAVGGIYVPFLPRWLEARGIFGFKLGVISAAAPAMGLFAPAVFGVVADALAIRVGLLQVACAGALLAFGTLTAAVAFGVPLGFGGLWLAALAIALFRSPMSLMADVVAIERASQVGTTYGRLRLWGSLGFLSAALVAGLWVDPHDALALPLVCTGAVAAGFVASLALPRRAELPHRGDPHSIAALLVHEDFRLFLVIAFLGQCGHVAYDMCFSLRLFDLGVPRPFIGLAWALGTGAEVVLMAWSAPVFRSFPAPTLLAWALAGASLRWILLATVRQWALLLLLQPLHAVSFGLVWLAEVSYTSRRFPSHSLATAQGLFASAVGAGSVVGMLCWGPVYQHAGGAFVFVGAACFAVCASAFAVALDRKVRVPVDSSTAIGP
jgi:PPP family 3-phenylpropionic acid transporter